MKNLMDFSNCMKSWFFINKTSGAFKAACVNVRYGYEIEKQTEKAIQIRIYKDGEPMKWTEWFPKSVFETTEK